MVCAEQEKEDTKLTACLMDVKEFVKFRAKTQHSIANNNNYH